MQSPALINQTEHGDHARDSLGPAEVAARRNQVFAPIAY
jgi:hypothetical protein